MNDMEMSCDFANYMQNSGFDWIKLSCHIWKWLSEVGRSTWELQVREFSITMKNDVFLLLDINTEKNQ